MCGDSTGKAVRSDVEGLGLRVEAGPVTSVAH